MDIVTLALAKSYTDLAALGLTSITVSGTTVTFTLTNGSTASVVVPTPADGDKIRFCSYNTLATAGGSLSLTGGSSYFSSDDWTNLKAGDYCVTKGGNFCVVSTLNKSAGTVNMSVLSVIKGDKGAPGDAGKSAVRGVDYWTDDDIATIDTHIDQKISSAGISVSDLADRVTNLEYVNQGYTYRYVTDSASMLEKTVPSNVAEYACIDSVGTPGSYIWNQLVSNNMTDVSYITPAAGTVSVNDNVATYTISSLESDSTGNRLEVGIFGREASYFTNIDSTHKYAVCAKIKSSKAGQPHLFFYGKSSSGFPRYVDAASATLTANTWIELGGVFTPLTNTSGARCVTVGFNTSSGGYVVGDVIQVRGVMLFDLTKLYGIGHEPSTFAEFRTTFADTYYNYNDGVSVKSVCNSIKSKASDGTVIATAQCDDEFVEVSSGGKLVFDVTTTIEGSSGSQADVVVPVPSSIIYMQKL